MIWLAGAKEPATLLTIEAASVCVNDCRLLYSAMGGAIPAVQADNYSNSKHALVVFFLKELLSCLHLLCLITSPRNRADDAEIQSTLAANMDSDGIIDAFCANTSEDTVPNSHQLTYDGGFHFTLQLVL